MSRRHLIVTGCDATHFELAEDLIASIRAVCGASYSIGFVRFCDAPLPNAIASQADLVVSRSDEYLIFNSDNGYYVAFESIKPKIPAFFPGFDIYTWIDADCWMQNDDALKKMGRASEQFDICIHPEYDVHYFKYPTPNNRTISLYRKAMPKNINANVIRMPMINSGVVSARRNSKIWRMWEAALLELRMRCDQGESSFFSDQIPLHYLIHTEDISVFPLRATDNWQTYACSPTLNVHSRTLCIPTFPHLDISIIHLAGSTKDSFYNLRGQQTRLRYRDFMKAIQKIGAPGSRVADQSD